MKKIGIYLLSALTLGFVACDDYDEALPQSNAQQPLMSVEGVEVAEGAQLSSAINLNTYAEDSLELIKTVKTPELNPGTSVSYDVEISATQDFATKSTVRLYNGKISKTDLNSAFRTLIGKTPNARTLNFRFVPYFTDGKSYTKISQLYLLDKQQSVTPVDLGIEIESVYYIVTDQYYGTGWNENLIALNHSDADVYDDPVFSLTTELAVGQYQFMGKESVEKALAGALGDEYLYAWGPETSGNLTGNLVKGTGSSFNVTKAGQYQITIDMLNNTFSVVAYNPILYAVGNFNNWTHNAATFIYERTEGVHSGFVDMTYDGALEFKFSTETSWNGTSYGADKSDPTLLNAAGDAGNLTLEHGGIYLFTLDTSKLTWKADEITSWGIIGNATPGGWDADTQLTYKGGLVWEAKVALTAGEYKFRANGAWNIDLGGDVDNLTQGGANIAVSEAGTYTVTLDLSDARAYKVTLAK